MNTGDRTFSQSNSFLEAVLGKGLHMFDHLATQHSLYPQANSKLFIKGRTLLLGQNSGLLKFTISVRLFF